MEAQQIRLNINELVNGIQDEAFLNACFETLEAMTNAYLKVVGNTNGVAPNRKVKPKAASSTKEPLSSPVIGKTAGKTARETEENSQPHDLSLVVLANEVFKGSEPAPPEASIAFRKALIKSASKQPTLPNRQ